MLPGADLSGATLSHADLSHANLGYSIIIGARYEDHDLKCVGANFQDATIDDEDLAILLSKGNAKNVPPTIKDKEELKKKLEDRVKLSAVFVERSLSGFYLMV
jgi:hypothetical protein